MSWIDFLPGKAFWRAGAVSATALALLGLCFLVYPIGNSLRFLSYDLPLKLRGRTELRTAPAVPGNDIVIVYMDTESARRLLPTPGAPWEPTYHAQLLRELKLRKAQAVVFDVLFTEMSATNSAPYEELGAAMRDFGKVIVGASYELPVVEGDVVNTKPRELPVPPIIKSASWGIVEFPKDSDGAVRKQRFFRAADGSSVTNLAWTAAEMLGRQPAKPGRVRWLNYYGPPGTLPSVPYHLLIRNPNALRPDELAGKVVFVGKKPMITTEGPARDDFPTPYGTDNSMPGVEIQATAYLNLVRGDWLNEAQPATELAICIVAALLFGFGLLVPRPWIAAMIAGASAICITVASIYSAWHFRVWFPWLIIGAVQIPVALAWAVLVNTRRVYHEKELLEQTLATARAASGSAQGTPATGSGPVAALSAINEAAANVGSDAPTVLTPTSVKVEQGIVGDHELVRLIGSGSYGEVWLGKSLVGIYRAVKVVYRKKFEHAAPFEREFRGLKRFAPISMSNRGFVQILHVGKNDADGYFYYVMELGDDETRGQSIDPTTYSAKNLGKELKRRGSLPVRECLTLGIELATTLEQLHDKELIHRDIKPSNIIFVHGSPKLADIGLVTAMEPDRTDVTYVGTPGYIAPEGPGSRAADIFSLGKVLYECAMGRDCQQYPELPSSLLARSDQHELLELNKVISKACDPDPRCRYSTAQELHTELLKLQTRFQQGIAVVQPPVGI